MPLRVAIVGSGVSGLAALWTLQQQQKQQHGEEDEIEIHLYEADDRVGGHTLTVPWRNLSKAGGVTMVDIAFTLYNKLTYRVLFVPLSLSLSLKFHFRVF